MLEAAKRTVHLLYTYCTLTVHYQVRGMLEAAKRTEAEAKEEQRLRQEKAPEKEPKEESAKAQTNGIKHSIRAFRQLAEPHTMKQHV
eukprot:1322547-Pyramimonas_sp.AAC.1